MGEKLNINTSFFEYLFALIFFWKQNDFWQNNLWLYFMES